MKYRTKLKIAFVIILLFPVLLSIMSSSMFGKSKLERIENNYDINLDGCKNCFDTTIIMARLAEKADKNIKEMIEQGSFSADYLDVVEKLNSELEKSLLHLVVYDDDVYTYVSSDLESELLDELPMVTENVDGKNYTYFVGNNGQYLVYPNIFLHGDGTQGVVYLLAETNRMLPEVEYYIFHITIVSISITILFIACLIFWGNRYYISPIRKLKKGMVRIAKGDMESSLEVAYEGELDGLCQNFEDMRMYLMQLTEENRQYDAHMREMISNISHDLKTPLTSVMGYVEGIMDGVADTPEKMDKYLKTIAKKTKDMERLLGELALYAKIDTDAIPYQFRSLNLKEYFEDCIIDLRTELENQGFSLMYYNYLEKDVFVLADSEQLHRVIDNIVSNSIKYNNKEKGVINIRVRLSGKYVHIEIEDNGKGVSQEEVQRIFERFYRTDLSRNSKTGGSGIGLSIVKKIVEDHGGIVWATGNVDVGMTVHIMLQIQEDKKGL